MSAEILREAEIKIWKAVELDGNVLSALQGNRGSACSGNH
jgi:hypothetical protein